MRIFIDSNIVISSILFPDGKVAKVFSHLLENHTVIISSYTKEECKKVFENKYPKVRDIKDLPVLVSAILSDSDILITGDKDFEDVKIDKPLIFTPSKYFELIAEKYGYI